MITLKEQPKWVTDYNTPQPEKSSKINPLGGNKKIYINGIKFEGPWIHLSGADLCRIAFIPTEVAEIEHEDGRKISIQEDVKIVDGDHFSIIRRYL